MNAPLASRLAATILNAPLASRLAATILNAALKSCTGNGDKWKILKWDLKPQTNKQTKLIPCMSELVALALLNDHVSQIQV